MQRKETKTERTRVLKAVDAQGIQHHVEEFTDFMRVEFLEGHWSDWTSTGRKLRMGTRPVNMLSDKTLELMPDGQRLTILP